MRSTFHRTSKREIILFAFVVLALVGGAAALMLRHMQPAPPSTIILSTGGQAGAYFAFAKRYAQILEKAGVKLDIKTSAGSLENLKRLKDPASGVDAAFLQGGIISAKDAPAFQSVGRLFHEPLWIFYRGAETLDRLPQLAGKRLAIGPEGSGTRQLATELLTPSGVSATTATLLPLSGGDAVTALKDGRVDAVFLVVAAEAPMVQALLREPEIRVMSLVQAEAYTRLFPYLSRLVLPQGVVDLVKNVPPADVVLLAPSAVLVVRQDLHPALTSLLAQAASEVHQPPSLFARAAEFPKTADPEFQVADSALRFYKNGAPFLQRYLPFWLANFVERMIVLAVPLATIAIPLFKFLPWLYKWRVRQRMLKWYAALKRVESRLEAQPSPSQITALTDDVERIEDEVNDSPVPLGFSEQFYNLRAHIDLVRQRLRTRGAATA
jgi:TRAP transporter TAXI family solute receptor